MKKYHLDLSIKNTIPFLHTKQGDVGRKFQAILTDCGEAYEIPDGAALSVWYSGTSGEGNYSAIGEKSAFTIEGNIITVELINQMVTNPGSGSMCLMINDAGGDQLGMWNIPYVVEKLPGAESEAAQQYYTAFSEAASQITTDKTLSLAGRAADAKAVGIAIAHKEQLKPEFANSMEECTDTAKLYVLPDGYLYAYMSGVELTDPTETAVNIQWAKNIKLDKATGTESQTSSGYSASQFIEISENSVYTVATQNDFRSYGSACWYRDGVYLGNNDVIANGPSPGVAVTGTLIPLEGATHVRLRWLTLSSSGEDMDKQLALMSMKVTSYTVTIGDNWCSTGHAFVPADYEDRILSLEESSGDQENRVLKLESLNLSGVPDYVCTEAERVADILLDKITADSLVIAGCSDMHHFYSGTEQENRQAVAHTGMGIVQIRKFLPMDLFVNFGDYVPGETVAKTKLAMKEIRSCLADACSGMEEMWLVGNHDVYPDVLTNDQIYAYIAAGNRRNVSDAAGKYRAYGYRDFDHCKIRVIYLNTSDHKDTSLFSYYMVSSEQARWLIDEGLNFRDKADAGEWGVVICSHIPLDMEFHVKKLLDILDAYLDRKKGIIDVDGEDLAYDFSKGGPEVICCFHGHLHNYWTGNIGSHGLPSIGVPSVCAERYNNYADSEQFSSYGEFDSDGNPVEYIKTMDTAESTSFVVNVIDRVNRKVHAVHFGAGIDREMEY